MPRMIKVEPLTKEQLAELEEKHDVDILAINGPPQCPFYIVIRRPSRQERVAIEDANNKYEAAKRAGNAAGFDKTLGALDRFMFAIALHPPKDDIDKMLAAHDGLAASILASSAYQAFTGAITQAEGE